MIEMMVFTKPNMAGHRRLPKWMRSVLVSGANIYVPSVLTDRKEKELFLCALCDGVKTVVHEGHIYFPSEWISREFSESKETIENIRKILVTRDFDVRH